MTKCYTIPLYFKLFGLGETMAISDRKKREKEYRRQSIIDAAEKLFFEKGYDNVSMNDIATEVELNRATIYIYFENKEALCFAVILRGVRLLNKMVKSSVKGAAYAQKIRAMWGAYYSFFKMYPQYLQVYNLFQSGRFSLSGLKGPVYHDVAEIIKLQKELFDILHSTIKTEKGGGRISSDVDPFNATFLIMSAIDTMINLSPMLKNEIDTDSILEYQFKMNFMYFVDKLLRSEQ